MTNNFDILAKEFNKKYKDEIIFKGIPNIKYARIPFTSPRANYMLYGGIPRNRMIEFFGDYSSGKTTTALDIVSNAQKLFEDEKEDKQVLFIDSEHTLDYEWAKKIGVDVDNIYVMAPHGQTAEQIFQMILEAVESGCFGLIVLDSLANLVSQQAMDKTMEEKTMAGISAPLTTFCTKLCPLLNEYKCTFIGINQVRCDLNNPYAMYSTPGGKSWKLNCSVRLQFQAASLFDEKGNEIPKNSENPHGNQVQMRVVKTKICKPNRKLGTYNLWYDTGIDKISDLFDIAQKENIILGKGWYYFIDPSTGEVITDNENKEIKINGKLSVIQYLRDNQEITDKIESFVNNIIEGN